jgi:hypothetical protein
VFAASFLITKALTRSERPEVIVAWQSITVPLLAALALWHWQYPTPAQWLLSCCAGCWQHGALLPHALLCDRGHLRTRRSRFLDLVWATLIGLACGSGDAPSRSTLVGGW